MFNRKSIFLAVAGAAALMSGAAQAQSATTTDCVLDWIESTYPGAFAQGGDSQSALGYRYRAYANGSLLGVQASENHLYYYGPYTNNALVKVDPVYSFLSASGCSAGTTGNSIQFAGIAYPASDADKRLAKGATAAYVNGNTYAIGFNTILRSGQSAGGGVFGQVYDSTGAIIQAEDGSARISDDNDHSTLLDVYGKVFMVSQFESRPAAFYITELNQDTDTGALTPVATKPIDFSALGGGWVHCAGSRTPWKSHLGSEEYEPDARLIDTVTGVKANACAVNDSDCLAGSKGEDSYYGAMGDYYGGDMTKVKPYRYGYIVEAKVTGADMGTTTFAGNVNVVKHYAMGRTANELAYVMPDSKTAYITDDGTMVGLYMFKADTAEDLSSGTLYAAKLTQTSADNGGAFTISWISLGSATNAEVRAFIDSGIAFADMFDAATPSKSAEGNYSCAAGYTGVSHGHAATVGNMYNECLKLKTSNGLGMTAANIDKAASRLETRRYAALKGATLELNKEEGITFNPDDRKLYIAMSDVTNGMKANADGAKSTTEAFSGDHIQLAANRCGTVYEVDVSAAYTATAMRGLVSGSAVSGDTANTCDTNGIANPDNVTYMPGYGTLIIGEDTGSGHQNDLIWSYNLASGALTRIQSTPYGSETTSPYFYPNINGWGYLMSVIQHPYGESDTDKADSGSAARRAYTGYVGPFPRMD
jgi:secreted PhoX family phosphatase